MVRISWSSKSYMHAYMYVWFDPDLSARLLEHEHDRAQALIPHCVAK